MLNNVDFSVDFYSPEILAKKVIEQYDLNQPGVYPIDPFKLLDELDIPVSFRDFKHHEGVYLAPDDEDDIPIVAIKTDQ
jgi:hypothetical protein